VCRLIEDEWSKENERRKECVKRVDRKKVMNADYERKMGRKTKEKRDMK
jgi:hypothetical protein